MREPVRHGPLVHVSAAGVGCRHRIGRARGVGGAVHIGQAAVELRDRADLEVLERFVDGADEADSPTPRQEHDAIAQREVRDRVRREHDGRGSVGKLAQVADQLRARGRVEAGRRLVQEEDARFGEELDGDAGALALPAAQRADPDVGVLGQPDGVDRGMDRVVDLGCGCRRREPEPGRVAERVSKREVGVDDVVLGHVADHAAELPQVGVQVDAVEAHRSRAGRGDAGDRLQQHRLAGTAGTDDRDELTGRDRERHGVQQRRSRLDRGPGPAGTARRRGRRSRGVGRSQRAPSCFSVPEANAAIPSFLQVRGHGSS